MTPADLREHVLSAKTATGLSWAAIGEALERPPAWTVAALFGMHPMPAELAGKAGALLDLSPEAVALLQREPYRVAEPDLLTDPTIYRFHEALTVYGPAIKELIHEALTVYGPAIKELIHEEFGDGIMSAINFKLDVSRRADPDGDRVVVTFDGKFLDYRW